MFGKTFAVLGASFVAAVLGASPASAQDADVLAPARAGQVQCYEPNVAAKTCQSIGAFRFEESGVIQNAADILIVPDPAVVMRVISPVTVRNGAVCGPLSREDISRANFTINGQRASEADTQQLRTDVAQQMSQIFGVESCISLTAVDGGFRADTTLNGTARPDLAQRVIWVRPDEGYRVAP